MIESAFTAKQRHDALARTRAWIFIALVLCMASCVLTPPPALHAQTNPRLVVRVANPSLVVGDSTQATATAYASDGSRSPSSRVTWRGIGLTIRPDSASKGQRATITGKSAGATYAVGTWTRSDGKILTDSAAITVTTPTPAVVAPSAIWYDDFQKYTSTQQILAFCTTGATSTDFWPKPGKDGNCAAPGNITLDLTGGPNGSKAIRYDWPARPTCPNGPTACSWTVALQPRFNPLPVQGVKELWIRFTDRFSPGFRIGGGGAVGSQAEYKFLFLDFAYAGGVHQVQLELDSRTGGAPSDLVMLRLKLVPSSGLAYTATDPCQCHGGGTDAVLPDDFFGGWNTWVIGLTNVGSGQATLSVYRNGALLKSITGPWPAAPIRGVLGVQIGANINNGPDKTQSRWFREIGFYRAQPNHVPLVTP